MLYRVKEEGGGSTSKSHTRPVPAPAIPWEQRNVIEQQAALNIASLATRLPELAQTDLLINTLLVSFSCSCLRVS